MKYEISGLFGLSLREMNRRNRALIIFGVGLAIVFVVTSYLRRDSPRLQHISGQTMGTIIYNVKFVGKPLDDAKYLIDNELEAFNQSLSTYIPDSEISRLNREGYLAFKSKFFSP
ncbi:MAG: hypothetical protein AAF789_15230, partial [Bacteroidota bacterium]